jgi:hypothetical protein
MLGRDFIAERKAVSSFDAASVGIVSVTWEYEVKGRFGHLETKVLFHIKTAKIVLKFWSKLCKHGSVFDS